MRGRTYQEEGEADTTKEQPLANGERNGNTAVCGMFGTTIENGV